MYGGLTFNSSENERDKLITVQVTIDNRQSLGFTITTNKNMVTIQELDYKARHWLTKEKKAIRVWWFCIWIWIYKIYWKEQYKFLVWLIS